MNSDTRNISEILVKQASTAYLKRLQYTMTQWDFVLGYKYGLIYENQSM